MTIFALIGVVGLLLVAAAAVRRMPLRAAVAGAFLAGFGFGAAALFPASPVSTGMAVVSGLPPGVTAATIAFVLGRNLSVSPRSPDQARPRVGALGTVVAGISVDGPGEVTLFDGQSRLTVTAHADNPIDAGATIVVIDVTSPDQVRVAQSHF